MNNASKIKRNITIYILVTYLIAALGGYITAAGNEAGLLLFVVSPILVSTLLRFFGGDGWKDAGLGLKLGKNWGWYLFSLLLFPLSFVIVISVGVLLGVTHLDGSLTDLLSLLLVGIGVQIVPRMLFALFEEWGWRGYMEPRLSALGIPDLKRHLFVGVVWAFWHLPLILSTDYTDVPLGIFLPLFVLGITISAVVYGQIRKASGTVWTAVLLHGVGNTVAFSIIEQNLVQFDNKVLFFIAPESILMIILWGLLGWWMLGKGKQNT